MTALHGALTGVEVDALRLPLKKNLSALADFPANIVTFRGHFARLTTARQAPLALDAYRLFLASLSSFPVFHQYTLLSTQLPTHHHTPNTLLSMPCNSITLLTNLTLLNNFYQPPLALDSTTTPTPWPMGFTLIIPPLLPLPLPTQPQTRKATDRKATNKTRKARHRLRQRQGHLTPTSLVPLCLALLNCTSITTSMAG
jgi:hypothetical protein